MIAYTLVSLLLLQ